MELHAINGSQTCRLRLDSLVQRVLAEKRRAGTADGGDSMQLNQQLPATPHDYPEQHVCAHHCVYPRLPATLLSYLFVFVCIYLYLCVLLYLFIRIYLHGFICFFVGRFPATSRDFPRLRIFWGNAKILCVLQCFVNCPATSRDFPQL